MLEYLSNTSTNGLCQYCPRREGPRSGAVLRSIYQAFWPSPTTTLGSRGHLNEGVMFGELRDLFFLCVMSVHVFMGMDVWVNVFTIPFFCADSGPWRKMSRAWPPMSAITTSSGSTCPNHQESAWGAAEARQEKVIVEVVRKGIVAGRCWNIC